MDLQETYFNIDHIQQTLLDYMGHTRTSLSSLARDIGISIHTLRDLLSGKRKPSLKTCAIIHRFLTARIMQMQQQTQESQS